MMTRIIYLSDNQAVMEASIREYEIKTTHTQEIKVPKGSQVLSVRMQRGVPCIWVVVYPDNEEVTRVVKTFEDGQPFDPCNDYVGTYQVTEGGSVFHVFINLED